MKTTAYTYIGEFPKTEGLQNQDELYKFRVKSGLCGILLIYDLYLKLHQGARIYRCRIISSTYHRVTQLGGC